jgi:hypothetical protein
MVIKSSFGIAKTTSTTIKKCFNIIQRVFLRVGERPNAKAFGASGSQVSPDFSARPAGLKAFLVYRKYTLPLEIALKAVFGILISILTLQAIERQTLSNF